MQNKIFKKGLVVGIIVLLAGISIMPLVVSIPINRYVSKTCPLGLDLSCDEPYKNVKQGDTALFIVEITNIGTIADTYDVIAGSIEDIICKINGFNADQFNPYEIILESGESISFEVTADVWESVPLGEWYIFVEAGSQNATEIKDDLTLTANVHKKNKVISNSEEDCNCIDKVSNIEEIIEKNEGLIDFRYSSLLSNNNNGLICLYLETTYFRIALIVTFYGELWLKYRYNNPEIADLIWYVIEKIYGPRLDKIRELAEYYNCEPFPP